MRLETLESRQLLATFQVTTDLEALSGQCDVDFCTIRDAIKAANENPGADEITFAPSLKDATFQLTHPLRFTESVSIIGLGFDDLTFSGRGTSQMFIFSDAAGTGDQTYRISDLTIANTRAINGGGAAIDFDMEDVSSGNANHLDLERVVIRNSRAISGAPLFASGGTLWVSNTSFVNNSSQAALAPSGNEAAAIMRVNGTTTIVNSTFSSNEVGIGNATLAYRTDEPESTMRITSTSFVNNASAAIQTVADGADASLSLQTTLFANNQAGTLRVIERSGATATIASLGNNLSHDGAGGFLNASSDRILTPVQIGPLRQDTFTHEPLPGSPAIDSLAIAEGDIPPLDQVGNQRDQGTGVDIGAIEVAFDFGDAPNQQITGFDASYPTLATDGGAYHRIGGPRLGPTVTSQRDGIPSGMSASNVAGFDDDDGVRIFGGQYQVPGETLSLAIDLQNAVATGNYLDAWIDWNRNGSWLDEGEQVATRLSLGNVDATRLLDVQMPDDLTSGPLHMRFRVSSSGNLQPSGGANDGEVEDYTVVILPDAIEWTVDNPIDESDGDLSPGDLSLREAIEYANHVGGNPTIRMDDALSGKTIDLNLGPLNIRRSMAILGTENEPVEIDAHLRSRIIEVDADNVDLLIRNLDFVRGESDDGSGGAIRFRSDGDLQLERTRFDRNQAAGDGGAIATVGGRIDIAESRFTHNQADGLGGAIAAADHGQLTIQQVDISSNTAAQSGGGIAIVDSTLQLFHSTLAHNQAIETGGGLYLRQSFGAADQNRIVGTTISGNEASGDAGALYHDGGVLLVAASTITQNETQGVAGGILLTDRSGTRTSLQSSIVAGNSGFDWWQVNSRNGTVSNFQSRGFNVLGKSNVSAITAIETDKVNIGDPKLAPLGRYGGRVDVHPLLIDSPALDSGSVEGLADLSDVDGDGDRSEWLPLDVRGVPRQLDLDGIDNLASGVDVGAVEMIGLQIDDAIGNESDGVIQFVRTLGHPLPVGTTVELTANAGLGSAVTGTDFEWVQDKAFNIAADDETNDTFEFDLIDDAWIESDESFQLLWQATPDVVLLRSQSVGTIVSDDEAGLVVQNSSLFVTEDAAPGELSVRLTARPHDPVTIDLLLEHDNEIEIDRHQLIFTTDNWNIDQHVAITAKNDHRIDNDQQTMGTLRINADSDADFTSLAEHTFTITSRDNDVAGITVTHPDRMQTTEAGRSVQFTVALDALPESDVTVSISSSDEDEAVVDVQTLTFTRDDGMVPQTVTVTGIDDPLVDGNVSLTIILSATESDDPNFDDLDAADVVVLNLDDDQLDFGDASDPPYPTRLANDGARHGISDLYLGTAVDAEPDAITGTLVDADDDDGVFALTTLTTSSHADSIATLLVTSSASGFIDAWMDFDHDGAWSFESEQIALSVPVIAGDNLIQIRIPSGASAGSTATRVRLSSDGGLSPLGHAADGEVEDHYLEVVSVDDPVHVVIRPPGSQATIDRLSGLWSVESNGNELFRSALAEGSSLTIIGTSGDDVFVLGSGVDNSVLWVVEAGSGEDQVVWRRPDSVIDLQAYRDQLRQIEILNVADATDATVRLNQQAVIDVTSELNRLDVVLADESLLQLEGVWESKGSEPASWNGSTSDVFVQVVQQQQATLRLTGKGDWTNHLNHLDVNASGLVTSIDALIVINELAKQRFIESESKLIAAGQADPFPGLYLDTNSDGRLTPLDALLVLNAIARANTGLASEQMIDVSFLFEKDADEL
ncbi:MAG: GEVED domain-containing protein [Pirellulaceae bacterium]